MDAVLTSDDLWDYRKFESHRDGIGSWLAQAAAYGWGRDDAGCSAARKIDTHQFALAYTLAQVVTDGTFGALQAAFAEWVLTGRLVVRYAGRYYGLHMRDAHGRKRIELLPIVWSGGTRWWDRLPVGKHVDVAPELEVIVLPVAA